MDSRKDLGRELRRVGMRLTEIIADRQKLAAIYFKESMSATPEFEELVHDFRSALAAVLTTFNEVLHARGLIAEANFELLANMTIGKVERIIMEYVIHDNFEEVPHEQIVEHLVVHYLSGTSEAIAVGSAEDEVENE